MNPRNDEAPTAATVRASIDPTPVKGIDTVNKVTTTTYVDVGALIQRAERAMLKRAVSIGYLHQFPDKALCTFDPDTQLLTLRNVRGDLAFFRYNSKSDRLVWIEVQS